MIGIICAMEEELQGIAKNMYVKYEDIVSSVRFKVGVYSGKKCVIALSGVGKVFASICAQTMIIKYKPDFIINIGTAGGIGTNIDIFDLIIAKNVIQHDYDISAFGNKKKGQISGINVLGIPCSKKIINISKESAKNIGIKAHIGNILTGDQFINDSEKIKYLKREFNGLACEMESAAIGQVCYVNNIEFIALKIISDYANKSSVVDFRDFIVKYPQIINNLIFTIVSKI